LEEAVVNMVGQILTDEHITVDWSVPGVRRPGDYVESWRILLWEKAFPMFIGSKDNRQYWKKVVFKEFPGCAEVVKRVVYRFVFYFDVFHCYVQFMQVYKNALSVRHGNCC
jgi:hypothetical protein